MAQRQKSRRALKVFYYLPNRVFGRISSSLDKTVSPAKERTRSNQRPTPTRQTRPILSDDPNTRAMPQALRAPRLLQARFSSLRGAWALFFRIADPCVPQLQR